MKGKKRVEVKRRSELSAKSQFEQALSYIKEARLFIYLSIILFFGFFIIGFVFADSFRFIDAIIADLIDKTKDMNLLEIFFYILQNNSFVSFIVLFSGFVLGIVPFINSISNGLIVGYAFSIAADYTGSLLVVWRLVPHGLFELPAIFISLGLGMHFGMFFLSKEPWKELKRRFIESMNVFLVVVLPLLILAAGIEALLVIFL